MQAIFKHTATIGIRETLCRRYVLTRTEEMVETALGPVRRKVSSGYGVQRAKFEHDDLAALAEKNGLSLTEVMEKIVDKICKGLWASAFCGALFLCKGHV